MLKVTRCMLHAEKLCLSFEALLDCLPAVDTLKLLTMLKTQIRHAEKSNKAAAANSKQQGHSQRQDQGFAAAGWGSPQCRLKTAHRAHATM